MNDPFLNIVRGGHRITMDRRDSYVRVNCNGVTYAQFNELSVGDIEALRHAISFVSQLEANALKNPKESP